MEVGDSGLIGCGCRSASVDHPGLSIVEERNAMRNRLSGLSEEKRRLDRCSASCNPPSYWKRYWQAKIQQFRTLSSRDIPF